MPKGADDFWDMKATLPWMETFIRVNVNFEAATVRSSTFIELRFSLI